MRGSTVQHSGIHVSTFEYSVINHQPNCLVPLLKGVWISRKLTEGDVIHYVCVVL